MRYLLTPDVGADDFHDFLTYLIFQKKFNAFQIRDVACYPHKFKREYSDFMDVLEQYKEKYGSLENFIKDEGVINV